MSFLAMGLRRAWLRWIGVLLLAALAAPMARAQLAPTVTDTWGTTAGRWTGSVTLTQDAAGRISGTIDGRPLSGYFDAASNRIAFVVGSRGGATHFFWGVRSGTPQREGLFGFGMALRAGEAAFSGSTTGFEWQASRGGPPPYRSLSPVTANPLPPAWLNLTGLHDTPALGGKLRLQQDAEGNLSGSWRGAPVLGHYERTSDSATFVRSVEGVISEVGFMYGPRQSPQIAVAALTPEAAERNGGALVGSPVVVRGMIDLSSVWRINGNGWNGALDLRQASDGRITGFMYGDPVQGFYSRAERRLVLLRGPLQRPTQAFVGDISADGEQWQGRLYTLDTGPSGGSFSRNLYAFSASRYGAAPTTLPSLPVTQGTGARLPRIYYFNNRPLEFRNTQSGILDFMTVAADNSFAGTLYGDPVYGHLALASGVLAMVRMRGDVPIQFIVGQAQAWPRQQEWDIPRFEGTYYALNDDGGVLPLRMTFDWTANWQGCAGQCLPY